MVDRLCGGLAVRNSSLHSDKAPVKRQSADVFLMSLAGHADEAWPDYIVVPEAVVVPDVAASSKPAIPKPAVYDPSRGASPVLPLLALVVALTAAATWFVGIPHLTKAEPVTRNCEVIVLSSGKTKCVANPRAGSKATRQSKSAKQ